MIGLMVGNVRLWPAKTIEWRRVTQDLRKGGSLEMLTIGKLIKIKVLWHQFSSVMFNLKIKRDLPVSSSLIVILPSYRMLRDYMR